MEKKDNSHKTWADGKKPSMKRRMEDYDYTERGIYMITLSTEGRQPLLGTLAGRPEVEEGPDAPHVILSPLGQAVHQCWQEISSHYPQIELIRLCIMPDHIHGVLFVHEQLPRHLGHVINGFKTGCRKYAEALPQPTQPQPTQPQPTPRPKHPKTGTIWEPGYNDRILIRKGQLARALNYLADNPRRLLIKRQYPQFFSRLQPIKIAGTEMQAMGNASLLDAKVKMQVQCSRHLYPFEIAQKKEHFLASGRQGAVIVSPAISPGEAEITTACMEAGIPLIVLLLQGFPPYFKPKPRYLMACAEGRLLLLSPFEWQNEKITDMRRRCLYLNDLAKQICE